MWDVRRLSDAISCGGVAIFFSLTGCFWFRSKKSYGRVVARFALTVLLPTLVLVLFAQLLRPWVFSADAWPRDLGTIDPAALFKGIWQLDYTQWDAAGGHLWYITHMLEMLLCYVPMRLVATHPDKKLRWGVTGLCLVMVLFADLSGWTFLPESVRSWLPGWKLIFPSYFVMMMLGQELYANRDRLTGPRKAIPALVLLLLLTWLRHKLDLATAPADGSEPLLTITGVFTFLSLPLLYVVFLSLRLPEGLNEGIRRLSSLTFGVYLVHHLVYVKLSYLGLLPAFALRCEGLTGSAFVNYWVYAAGTVLLCFAVSALIALPFHLLMKPLRRRLS